LNFLTFKDLSFDVFYKAIQFEHKNIFYFMAYDKFKKLEQVNQKLQIIHLADSWLPKPLPEIDLTNKLIDDLQEAIAVPLTTEKAKSEYIVVPILKELSRQFPRKFTLFSGFEFNVDKSLDLNGYCDYILSAESQKLEVTAPIFCLVEAKNAEIELGWGQCAAEMYAAQLFNAQQGKPKDVIYGCVTNAFSWCFLKLEGKLLTIDPNYVPLTFDKPAPVLNVLSWIVRQSF
jgi:hypothetical protein